VAESSGRVEHSKRQRNRRGDGGRLRELLIAAAMTLLERAGHESAVTIRAVTREAGVVPQSFYLHFRSLDELLFALYAAGYDRLEAALDAALTSVGETTPSQRMATLCTGYLDFATRNAGLYRVLMGSTGRVHPDWDPARLPGAATYARLLDAVTALRGEPSIDRNGAHVVTSLLWAQLHGLASLMASRPTYPWPNRQELVDQIVATAARGRQDAGSNDHGEATRAQA
jgi:AcrR family transcriptional regulator